MACSNFSEMCLFWYVLCLYILNLEFTQQKITTKKSFLQYLFAQLCQEVPLLGVHSGDVFSTSIST